MEFMLEKKSCPVKITVIEKAEVVKQKKAEIFNRIKGELIYDGFRKGNVPQEIAEQKIGKQEMYKSIVDELYMQAIDKYSIVFADNFKIYGDFQDKYDLKLEFIAEVKPYVVLPMLQEDPNTDSDGEVVGQMIAPALPEVTDEEINQSLTAAQKEKETMEDAGKEVLENLDVAIIDFEGTLYGETEPFKGGSAKAFSIDVNKVSETGQKAFIDNFEDQMVGMKIGETRKVDVKFPDDYRDASKSGKRAIFVVTLVAIKKRVLPEINDQLAILKGFSSLEEFKTFLKGNILAGKTRDRNNELKKMVVGAVLDKSIIDPLPDAMIEDEVERQWKSMLNRLGHTEDEYLKKVPDAKTTFWNNNKNTAIEMLKTSLVLERAALEYHIEATKQEVIQYAENLAMSLGYTKEKTEKLVKECDNNPSQYDFLMRSALNEKTVDFLVSKVVK